MKRNAFIVACGIALIGGMSAFLLLQQDPEYVYVTSDDGVVTVSGMAREAQSLDVDASAAPMGSVLTGQSYMIGTPDATLDAPMRITFRGDAAQTVYRYRTALGSWEPVEDVRFADGLLHFSTNVMGAYAIGKQETVTTPEFMTVYEGLRDARPDDAVGYTIHVSYARPGEPSILLPLVGEQGGCGGAVLPGLSQAESQTQREASVLVNDVQTTVTFSFRATWSLSDAGCPELSPFRPANEHGILPLSQ